MTERCVDCGVNPPKFCGGCSTKGHVSPAALAAAREALEEISDELETLIRSEFQTTRDMEPQKKSRGLKKARAALEGLNPKEMT